MRRAYKIWSDIAPNSLGGFPKNFVSALTCWNSVDFWLLQLKMKERPVCRVVSKTWRMTPRDDAAGFTNKPTSGAARCTGDSANDWNRTWLLDMTVAWTVQNRLAKMMKACERSAMHCWHCVPFTSYSQLGHITICILLRKKIMEKKSDLH